MARPKNCGRCRKPKTRCDCGRPTVMTPEVMSKLEIAFGYGASDLEACGYADISVEALYKYQKRNPKYVQRKALLKEKHILLARESVIKGLHDPRLALDYLKAKRRKEFAERVEQEIKADITAIMEHKEETDVVIQKFLDARHKNNS